MVLMKWCSWVGQKCVYGYISDIGSGVGFYFGSNWIRWLVVIFLVNIYDEFIVMFMFLMVILCNVYRLLVISCGWKVIWCCLLLVVWVSVILWWQKVGMVIYGKFVSFFGWCGRVWFFSSMGVIIVMCGILVRWMVIIEGLLILLIWMV